MSAVVWVDGHVLDPHEPLFSAQNHGVTVGDGVYETVSVRAGTPFALSRHLVRLQYSLDRVGMSKVDLEAVRSGVTTVLDSDPLGIGRIRITVISGVGPAGYSRGPGEPIVMISGAPGRAFAPCVAVRSPWRRNERSPMTGVKSTSAAENVVTMHFAAGKGADEAIIGNTLGHLCEGTGSNVFIERGGEVVTPPLQSGCLAGIARGLALEWGAQAGIPVRVAAPGELDMTVLDEVTAGKAFAAVSSSTRGVQPISRLDGVELVTGPLLGRLAALFEERADEDLDPAPPRSRTR